MTKTRQRIELSPDSKKQVFVLRRSWETQPSPYKNPLPYSFEREMISGSYTPADPSDVISYYDISILGLGSASYDREGYVHDMCYARFVDELNSTKSQLANNLLESHQTVQGIVSRASQLLRFTSQLKKGNIVKAAKILGTPIPKKLRGPRAHLKSVGDQFLEFHFGWEPLLQDIHNGAVTLSTADFGEHRCRASFSYSEQYSVHSEDGSFGSVFKSGTHRLIGWKCKMQCTNSISNPNAYLANQFGLINPFSVAWEAVPFSFVADWFGNVGQCLSAMTDFVGLDISRAFTTTSLDISQSGFDSVENEGHPVLNGYGSYQGQLFKVGRETGIRGPTLRVYPFKGLSVSRAATAISLLLQKLR